MFIAIKKNRGFGIIEVLITTLVISLGLMAVASLQGRLISDSRGNKVVSEARSLCGAQLEDFRDSVVMGAKDGTTADSYNAILDTTNLATATARKAAMGFPKTITGQNEIFTVDICVEDLPNESTTALPPYNPPHTIGCPSPASAYLGTTVDPDSIGQARKRVVASCTWGSASNDERVDLETLITYESIRNMIKNAKAPSSSVSLTSPNTNAGSSDDLQSRFKMPTGTTAGTIVNWGKDSTMGQHMKVDSAPDGNGNLYGTLFYYCDSRDITNTSTASGKLVYYEGDVFTRRVNYFPSFPDNTYREAIELFYRDRTLDPTGNMCVPKVRYNGGIIIPIKGRVYTASTRKLNGTNDNPASPIRVAASESGIFCAPISFNDVSNTTTAANYACYIGGNCISSSPGTVKEDATGVTPNATPLAAFWPLFDNTTAAQYTTYNSGAGVAAAIAANAAGTVPNAVAGDKTIVTQCPTYANSTATGYPDKVFSMVGPGGWRGKLGLIGTVYGSTGGSYDNVCFAEELSTTYNNGSGGSDTIDSARNYFTRRGSGNSESNEGINTPYMCHDFLIVNGSSSFDSTCRSTSGALKLASKEIMRDFISSSSPNTVDLIPGKSSCHTIHGTVPAGVTAVGVGARTINDTYDGNFECTMTKTAGVITGYECIGTSRTTAVKIASTAGTDAECYLTLATANMNPTCNLLLPGTATYTVSGNLIAGTNVTFGTQTGRYNPLTALSFSGNGQCSITAGNGNSYSYSCTYLVTGDSVLFDAGLGFSPNPKLITVASANVNQNITINGTPTYSLTIITTGAGGTTNPAPATYTYNQGDSVSITALPDTGYQFTGWTGACAGVTTPTCTITMDANKTVTPTFAPSTTYTLTIITSGSGGTTNPAAGTYTYTAGQTATITATPSSGYIFVGWSGACTGTGTCTVTMSSDKTVTATFAPAVTYNLNIITAGSGGTTDPVPGVHVYNSSTVVNITATASTGYEFTGWSGACTGIGVCTVTMDADKTVTATFAPVTTYNLNIITSGAGGSTNPAAGIYTYNAGTNVTITATASTGYVFSGWSGDCTGTGTCSVTMNANKNVTATFTAKTAYTLSIVTPGSGGTTDPVPGTYTYYSGDSVTITAKPNTGYKFSGWSGACSGTALSCTVTMDMSKTVSATFTQIPSCSVNITGNATKQAAVTDTLGCNVKANANSPYAYTCPTASGVADGTVVTVSSGGVDKTVTVGCSTNGATLNYTVNFP